MKKLSITIAVLFSAGLLTAALATAKPKDVISPQKAAKQQCRAEMKADEDAFEETYGNRALRQCAEDGMSEARDDIREAAKACREESGRTDRSRPALERPRGNNGSFGRCVSSRVRSARYEGRAEFKNAAQECRAERGDTEESRWAFEEKYGTKRDMLLYRPARNAFGKCVSSKVRRSQN